MNDMKKLNHKIEEYRKEIIRDDKKAHVMKLRSLRSQREIYHRINGLQVLKAGIFNYYGLEIDPHNDLKLWGEEIYRVYRPIKSIRNKNLIRSFDGVPLLFNQCCGKGHALKYDAKRDVFFQRAGGTFGCALNPRYDNSKKAILVDVVTWDDDIYRELKAQKALKLTSGYHCSYAFRNGKANGKEYEVVQIPKYADHVNFAIKVRGDKYNDVEQLRAIPRGSMVEDIVPCQTDGKDANAATGTRAGCAT